MPDPNHTDVAEEVIESPEWGNGEPLTFDAKTKPEYPPSALLTKKVGHWLEGEYLGLRIVEGMRGERTVHTFYFLRGTCDFSKGADLAAVNQGDRIEIWGSKVLDFALRRAVPGDKLGILYQGKKPGEHGTSKHLWSVVKLKA